MIRQQVPTIPAQAQRKGRTTLHKNMKAFLRFLVLWLAAVAYGASAIPRTPEAIAREPVVSKGVEAEAAKKTGKSLEALAGLVQGSNGHLSKESLEELIEFMQALTAGEYTGVQSEVVKKARKSLETLSGLLQSNDGTLSKEGQKEVFEIMQGLTTWESALSDQDSEYWCGVIKAGLTFLCKLFRKLFGF